jgi:hypothetical protein
MLLVFNRLYTLLGVGIAAGYRLDCRGSIPGKCKILLCFTESRPVPRPTQPPIKWLLGAKRPGREADHSPPPSAEVKNGGAAPPFPIHFHGVVLN